MARLPHASVATVPASWATPVPDGVDLAQAALVYMAIISGYGVQRAELQPGEPLGVVGAGPIGVLAQRLGSLQEPGEVTVMATGRRREALALRGGADRFLTVYLSAPLEVCKARDSSGAYKLAESGQIASFPGVSAVFEEPASADLVLPTHEISVEQSVDRIIELLKGHGLVD